MSSDDWFQEISVFDFLLFPTWFWCAVQCEALVCLLEYPTSGAIAAYQSVIVWICGWYESETYWESNIAYYFSRFQWGYSGNISHYRAAIPEPVSK